MFLSLIRCASLLASPLVLMTMASVSNAEIAKIYYAGNSGIISRANLDGSNVEVISTLTTGDVQGLEIDSAGGKMYWGTPATGGEIRRANWSDGSAEQMISTILNPQDLVLDLEAGHLYFTSSTANPRLRRIDLDGGNDTAIVSAFDVAPQVAPWGIDLRVQTSQLYWADGGLLGVRSADLDGTNIQNLVTTGFSTRALAIDEAGGFVFWSEVGAGFEINRATLSGAGSTAFITGLAGVPNDLEVDPVGGKLYWVIQTPGLIQRADLDGSNVETILSSLVGGIRDIALLRAPSPEPVPALGHSGALALIGIVLACGALATRARFSPSVPDPS
jgi:hypothetical protein